jgi:hypothetical protein
MASVTQSPDRVLDEEHTDNSATYSYNDPLSDPAFHAVIQRGVHCWLYSVYFYDGNTDTRVDGSCYAVADESGIAFDCAHAVVMAMWAVAQEAFNAVS